MTDRIVLVALDAASAPGTETAIGRDLGLDTELAYRSPLLGLRLVRFRIPNARAIDGVLAALAQDASVVSAQPEYVFRSIQAAQGGAAKVPQYAAEKMYLSEAHKIARGRRVPVAIVDTQIDTAHPELKGVVTSSFNALGGGQGNPESHGTAIAGILAARAELAGVAPEALVLAVRAFSGTGGGVAQSSTLTLIKGIEWAIGKGARVLNLSFAGPLDPLLGQIIEAASAQGAIFVAAAGNAGPRAPPAYPAAFPSVIAVTATDDGDRLYDHANHGSYISVAAPGVDILAPAPGSLYEVSTGTSMAAAHVTGVVALILERNSGLDATAVRDILAKSARLPKGKTGKTEIGAGIVDAARALEASR